MFLPIAERELRIRARRPGIYTLRFVAANLAIALATVLMSLGSLSPGKAGAGAFITLTTLTFLYCLYEGLRNTADCLSEEKRAGTLGFLFLTDLKGYDVVIGKLLATSLSSFYALLAILPAIGLPLLSGGVTAGEFWRAVLVLMVTLFFSLSAGMFVSSASRSERRAWTASLAIILCLTVVPLLVRWIPFMPFRLFGWISPSVAFSNIFEARYKAPDFWGAVAGVHALSWIFLAAASIILPRAWQERPAISAKRIFMPMNAAKRLLLLETNPVLWLASRDERIKVYLWGLVALFGASFLVVWGIAGFAGPVLIAFCVFIFAIHFLIAVRVAFHVCHAFGDAKDQGLLELLLSTPLTSDEILDGFRAALKRLFGGPVILLLWLEGAIVGLHFFFSGSGDLGFSGLMLLVVGALAYVFVMDLHAVATYGMWVSLTAKKPSQAFNKTALMVMVLPTAIGFVCCNVAYPIAAIFKNLIFSSYRVPLYQDFRKTITQRISTILPPK